MSPWRGRGGGWRWSLQLRSKRCHATVGQGDKLEGDGQLLHEGVVHECHSRRRGDGRTVSWDEDVLAGCPAVDWCPGLGSGSLACSRLLAATIGQAAATAGPTAAGGRSRVVGEPIGSWGRG